MEQTPYFAASAVLDGRAWSIWPWMAGPRPSVALLSRGEIGSADVRERCVCAKFSEAGAPSLLAGTIGGEHEIVRRPRTAQQESCVFSRGQLCKGLPKTMERLLGNEEIQRAYDRVRAVVRPF